MPYLSKENCPLTEIALQGHCSFSAHAQFSSVQSRSCVWLFATPWTIACQASLSITNSRSLLKLMSIELVITSNHFILCRPLFLLPSIFPSIRVFSNESLLATSGQRTGGSASTSVLPKNIQDWFPFGWTGWISFAVQGTLVFSNTKVQKHHSLVLTFFIDQLSHPYMTTRKTIALTRWTFVGEVMSLLFNMLSRLVITFLPRSKHLFISWLQSPSAVILEPKKIKVSHCFPIYLPWSDGTGCHDLCFLNVEF